MMHSVCAIVVTYNRRPMLEKCVEALLKQSVPCDILVVNNASTDDTTNYLSHISSQRLNVIALPENTGGAGGFNIGMRTAVQRGYTHLWIMDDDTLPRVDALEKLLQADERIGGDYGFLSSVALWTDGKECRMNRQKLRKSYYQHIELLQYGMVRAEQATFVSCFFRAEIVRRAGLPIKDFFIWGDDIEYTRRLAVRMNLPCFVVGQSIVVHAMKSNLGSNIATDDFERISRYHYAYRNENYLYRKEGMTGIAYYVARCVLHLGRVWSQANDHRLRRSFIIVRQMLCGCFFNPRIEYARDKEAEQQ